MHRTKSTLLIACGILLIASLACNFPGIATTNDAGENPAQTQPPLGAILPSPGLPTLTLEGGSGFVFSAQRNTNPGEDYDIWWNNAEIVALGSHSYIISLGVLGNLSEVDQIDAQGMTSGALVPSPGEGFALKIEKGEGFEYALIRMLKLEAPNLIVLEYIYPFQGSIIGNP